MKRRTYLLGLAGVSGVSTFVLGTGAFSSVRLKREVSINVVPDDQALLSLKVPDPGDAIQIKDGKLVIDAAEEGEDEDEEGEDEDEEGEDEDEEGEDEDEEGEDEDEEGEDEDEEGEDEDEEGEDEDEEGEDEDEEGEDEDEEGEDEDEEGEDEDEEGEDEDEEGEDEDEEGEDEDEEGEDEDEEGEDEDGGVKAGSSSDFGDWNRFGKVKTAAIQVVNQGSQPQTVEFTYNWDSDEIGDSSMKWFFSWEPTEGNKKHFVVDDTREEASITAQDIASGEAIDIAFRVDAAEAGDKLSGEISLESTAVEDEQSPPGNSDK